MGQPGRKSEFQELKIKQSLAEVTPLMFAFVKKIMKEGSDSQKLQVTTKLLPKILDKAMPTEIDHGGKIEISIAKEVADKNEVDQSTSIDSEGQPSV